MVQVIANILIAASAYILFALSFVVIYRTARFFNFAHGVVFTAGAYFVLLLKTWLGFPFLYSIPLSIFMSMVLGSSIEIVVYRPLRNRRTSELVMLLASLGTYMLLQNIISIAVGDETKSIREGIVQKGLNILGASITPIQIVTICLSIVVLITVSTFLKRTKIGSAMRAVGSDPELARMAGIDSNTTILWAFAIGSSVAGLTGILVALDVDMTPTMGMHALMMGVVVVIIGGVNSTSGIALGALLLGMAQHFGAWFIGSQWQDAIAFVILVLFLLFKPEGFFGKKIRSATV